MASGHPLKKIRSLLPLFLLAAGCGGNGKDDTWDALLGAIPAKLSLGNTGETGNYYVLRQTHEAVFRYDDGQRYVSKILTEWTRSVDFREYRLCPDTSLRFNMAEGFSLEYFEGYLKELGAKFAAPYKLSRNKCCAIVEFETPQPGYLDFLAKLENAPTIRTAYGDSDGLGPYALESISGRKVVLKRKKRVSGGYNHVVLHEYAGSGDSNLQSRNIEDFNKLSSFDQPGWIKTEYRQFNNIELKSISLAINHPDPAVRRVIHDCIDVDKFRRAFVPKRSDFIDIETVLPAGVPGSKPGKIRQNCSAALRGGLRREKLSLVNQKKDNLEQLGIFADNFRAKTGISIQLKNLSPQEISVLLKGRAGRHDYNLILIVLDTVRPDYDVFFEYILGKSATIDFVPQRVHELHRAFLRSKYDEKQEAAVALADQLNLDALILTLYQTSVPIYYPKKIHNIFVGKGFAQYPEVADFRW